MRSARPSETSRSISPTAFALRQLLSAWAPWLVLALIVVGIGMGAAHYVGGSTILHILWVALLFLATGGVALGYAAAWMEMIHRGMVPTPRTTWQVGRRDEAVHIAA